MSAELEKRVTALEEQVGALARALAAVVDAAEADAVSDPFATAFQNFRQIAAERERERGVPSPR